MAVKDKVLTDNYAIYNGDCIEVMAEMPDNKIDMSIYSPPFASMYTYSSSDRDLGNNKNYEEFLQHYRFVVKELFRITKPGRMTCVHCMDIPRNGDNGLIDFPGDIIRMHQNEGFKFWDRKNIWKEPLRVAIRTRQRALMHVQLVTDTSKCRGALADYLLIFKKKGENETPIEKPYGLTSYDGDLSLMNKAEREEYDILHEKYINYEDDKTNRLSQFIWRRYASSAWEDVRANRALCYKPARDKDDDRHVCPLQLDIITRSIILYTNPGEIVFTPFMGVASEVFGAVINNRKGIGVELKESYFNQSVKNMAAAKDYDTEEFNLFTQVEDEETPEATE
jgi:DNA modification methylase